MVTPNLPWELESEILSRVPPTSVKQLRLTCKRWYALFKDPISIKKHLGKAATQMILKNDESVFSFSFSFHELFHSQVIKLTGILKSLKDLEDVKVSKIFHCKGLLLCTTKDNRRVLWNPCTGQTRSIQSEPSSNYYLGYENKKKSGYNYKILSCSYYYRGSSRVGKYEIYEFNSDSWRVLDAISDDWLYLWPDTTRKLLDTDGQIRHNLVGKVSHCLATGHPPKDWLREIVCGPKFVAKSYPRYCTRGYAFRVLKENIVRRTVDCGVSSSSGDDVYYGNVREILEIQYPGMIGMRCIVFNCEWYDNVVGRGVSTDAFGVTSVHSRRRLDFYDPFILASQADQVCYIRYPRIRQRNDPWIVVMSINPRSRVQGVFDPLQQQLTEEDGEIGEFDEDNSDSSCSSSDNSSDGE
uniref:F-box domain-containing protein n=2 Tax=Brassica oleracea var. oleracea TaxID=109376 RepID=A0A0D3ACU9_BRAOL